LTDAEVAENDFMTFTFYLLFIDSFYHHHNFLFVQTCLKTQQLSHSSSMCNGMA